jgi:hypothetical protein
MRRVAVPHALVAESAAAQIRRMTRPIITRADAAAHGLKRFYTGKVCKRGHDAERYTRNGTCVECGYWRQADPRSAAFDAETVRQLEFERASRN